MVISEGQERRRRRVIMLVGVCLVLGALGALGLLRVVGGLEGHIADQNRLIRHNQQLISDLTSEVRDLCAGHPEPCPSVIVTPNVTIVTVPPPAPSSTTTSVTTTTLRTVPSVSSRPAAPATTSTSAAPATTSSTRAAPSSTTSSSTSSSVPQCGLPLPALCGIGSTRGADHRP